jgi:hypothetical protein
MNIMQEILACVYTNTRKREEYLKFYTFSSQTKEINVAKVGTVLEKAAKSLNVNE